MATQYISRIALEVNGQEIDDFESVTEKKVTLAKQVKLMNGTGYCLVVPRYEVDVDYVIPSDTPEFDFTQLTPSSPGTLTIDRQNGTRITYQGVSCIEIGDTKYNSEKEATKQITLGATAKVLS